MALIVLRIICPPHIACHALDHIAPAWVFCFFPLKLIFVLFLQKNDFLLKYNWHVTLILFQVYKIMIQYLYTLYQYSIHCVQYMYTPWNDHHSKSSYHLLLYEAITQLLTIGSTLYILYPWCIYFVTVYLGLLISLSYFFLPPTPSHLATTYLFSVFRTLFLFSHVCTFVLFFRFHMSMKSHCLSLSDLFHFS